MTFWTPQNENTAMNSLVSQGVQPLGAAALVSRWANVESPNLGPSDVNPTSGAYGVAQWLGSRQTALYGTGNPSDFQTQLGFTSQELNSTESASLTQLNSATDTASAATGASMFERAAGYNPSTGVDNFTAQTEAGIPGVLANYQPAGTGSPSGGTSSTFAPNSVNSSVGTVPQSMTSQLPSMFGYTTPDASIVNSTGLGATPGTVSGTQGAFDVSGIAPQAGPTAPTYTQPFAGGATMPAAGQSPDGSGGYSAPTQAYGDLAPQASSFTNSLAGLWDTQGVQAVATAGAQIASADTTSANTIATAASKAAQLGAQTSAADTGALTAAGTSWLGTGISSLQDIFIRGGVLMFGLVFLVGGVMYFSRNAGGAAAAVA